MKKLYVFLMLIIFCGSLNPSVCRAQYLHKVDSLMKILHNAPNDSMRYVLFRQLSKLADNVSVSQALQFGLQEAKAAEKSTNVELIERAYVDLGDIYRRYGDKKSALSFLLKAIALSDKNKNDVNKGIALQSMGNILSSENRSEEAITAFLKALNIFEKYNEKSKAYAAMYALYSEYYYIEDFAYYRKYLNKAITLAKEANLAYGASDAEQMRGIEDMDNKQYNSAILHFTNALKYCEKTNDLESVSYCCGNIGECYHKLGNLELAKEFAYKSYLVSKQLSLIGPAKTAAGRLGLISYKLKFYFNAYQYLSEYILLNDSVNKQSAIQELADLKSGFNRELKEKELDEEKLIEQKEKEEQQRDYIIFIIVSAVLLFLLYGVFSRYRFKVKSSAKLAEINGELNLQNEEIALQRDAIERQKEVLDKTNLDITNSIIYAKHLQDAILPEKDYVKKLFKESFVLFKPKDIVSGDFYWFDEFDNSIYIAVADCTGHGVPGAFMSLVNFNLLKHAIHEHKKHSPAEILNQVNKDLSATLRQSYQDSAVRDGMDISLIQITGKKMVFAGANNSIYIMRQGEKFLEEIKADKQPIGNFLDEEMLSFTNKEIYLHSGDLVYLYSDGYPDQFGGPKGKKFKYKQLEELIVSISESTMNEQALVLENKFEEWKGILEQIDDVTIIGLKIG